MRTLVGLLKIFAWSLILASVIYLGVDLIRFLKVAHANYLLSQLPFEAGGERPEAIIVLTGDRVRIPKAFQLMHSRKSEWLIISGAGRGITLTEVVNQQGGGSADSIHTVWERIILESRSASTIENGIESAKIARQRQVKSLVLVTSDYHMQRAATIFRKLIPEIPVFEFPVSSGVFVPEFSKFFRILWIVGLEYWKYRLYLVQDL